MGFKLKSGNGPLQFKQMGASPAKQTTDFAAMQIKSAKKDARYGEMSAKDYKTEVKRQVKSHKETGSYDAMNTAKNKKIEKIPSIKPKEVKLPKGKKDGPVVASEFKPSDPKAKKGNWFKRLGRANEKLHKFRNSEEGAQFKDTMNQAGNVISGNNNLSTNNKEAFQKNKRASESHAVKMENVQRDQLKQDTDTKRTQQLVQAAEDAKNKTYEVAPTKPTHVGSDNKANMDVVTSTANSQAFKRKTKA